MSAVPSLSHSLRSRLQVSPSLAWVRLASTTSTLRPFEAIPAVPGAWPVVGNFFRLGEKPHGWPRLWSNITRLQSQYDTEGVGLLRMSAPALNRAGQGRVVILSDPQDVPIAYQHEGPYPDRGQSFEVLRRWRQSRPDMFGETTGVLLEEGPRWHEIRSMVQQDMMRPQSAFFYLDPVQTIASDFVEFLHRQRRSSPDGATVQDLLPSCYAYGFEGSCAIALDQRMGLFQAHPDPEMLEQLARVRVIIEKLPELVVGSPWWRLWPSLSANYRQVAANLDIIGDFVKSKIDQARQAIKTKADNSKNDEIGETSVLEKLILKNGWNSSVPFVMSFDFILAGLDTTGASLGFLFYHLAANPEKQYILRQEILSHPDHITEKSLNQMRYLKACLKESARLTPITPFHVRIFQEDFSLKGFQIPANTLGIWSSLLMSRDPKYVSDSDEFQPERWLRGSEERMNPFVSLPFGHGPRMCVGKRFADLEMQVLMIKVLQNFRLEWVGSADPMETLWKFTNVPSLKLDFKLHEL